MSRSFLLPLTAVVLFSNLQPANADTGVLGDWLADNGKTQIRTYPCKGEEDAICSSITWLKNPRKDANNENPDLRERPLIGVEVGKNMRPEGKDRWQGTVYSPKRGKTYPSTVRLKGDVLKVKGCLTSARVVCTSRSFSRLINAKADEE